MKRAAHASNLGRGNPIHCHVRFPLAPDRFTRETSGVQLPTDPATAYAAVDGRDSSWDGRLYLGVSTTGIYCRPSCPARTPRPENCQYFPTAAAAVASGFRACKRCRPDALPGTKGWSDASDLSARAVRLIAEGALDGGTVDDLARTLAVSSRHLTRLLAEHAGASPRQLGITRRAHTARLLLDQTSLRLTDIAYAAGFGSIRQFNDVMREQFGAAPSQLRTTRTSGERAVSPELPNLTLRLRYRPPLNRGPLRRTLAAHAIDGVEAVSETTHHRILDGAHGPVRVSIDLSDPATADRDIPVHLVLTDLADLMPSITRLRRWLDLDADPTQIADHLSPDRLLAPLVARYPGLRVPGAVDGAELAVCAVLGQQVSLAGARTFQGRLARAFGTPVATGAPGAVIFPTSACLADAGAQAIRDACHLTQSRARAVHAIATACAQGLDLSPGADPGAARAALLQLPGVGPWTADYIALRALHDPDAFLPTDLVARKALAARCGRDLADITGAVATDLSNPWRPWRSYALQQLWTSAVYDTTTSENS